MIYGIFQGNVQFVLSGVKSHENFKLEEPGTYAGTSQIRWGIETMTFGNTDIIQNFMKCRRDIATYTVKWLKY